MTKQLFVLLLLGAGLVISCQAEKLSEKEMAGKNPAAPGRIFYHGARVCLQLGDYLVRFSPEHSWTFSNADYKGKLWLQGTGYSQSVVMEKNLSGSGTDPFLGSGHRKEQIKDVTILVYGENGAVEKMPINSGLDWSGSAGALVVSKKSLFVSEFNGALLEHESIVAIRPDGIAQQCFFRGLEGKLENIAFAYPFMFIFPASTQAWICGDDDGKQTESGTFGTDNSFTLNGMFRWCLIFYPERDLATVYSYPETYRGMPRLHNRFWNRPGDNKLYFMTAAPGRQGEEKCWRVHVSALVATTADWRAKAGQQLAVILDTTVELSESSAALGD